MSRLPIQKNPPTIYVVTTLRFGFKYLNDKRSPDGKYHSFGKRTSKSQRKYFTIIDERTWGWYSTLAKAKESVEHNYGDMYEGDYSHAVIEKTPEGILCGGHMPKEWWYQWRGTWEKGKYVPWKKPKEYDNVISFMGRIRQIKAHWGIADERHKT
jgi:hypothetical protein